MNKLLERMSRDSVGWLHGWVHSGCWSSGLMMSADDWCQVSEQAASVASHDAIRGLDCAWGLLPSLPIPSQHTCQAAIIIVYLMRFSSLLEDEMFVSDDYINCCLWWCWLHELFTLVRFRGLLQLIRICANDLYVCVCVRMHANAYIYGCMSTHIYMKCLSFEVKLWVEQHTQTYIHDHRKVACFVLTRAFLYEIWRRNVFDLVCYVQLKTA